MRTFIALSLLAVLPVFGAEKSAVPPIQQQSTVIVGGQVRRPGPVAFQKNLTIYAVIQAAGGATEFGAMRRVKVIRDGEVKIYDLQKDEQKLILAQAEDTIEVPQKNVIGR